MTQHRPIVTAAGGREFAAFPVAVLAFVLNDREEFLLLKRPSESAWQIPSGALESGEAPVQGVTRELREELGAGFRHRVLGPVHATSFRFDERITAMLSIGFVVQHLDGPVLPGDDVAGAEITWAAPAEIAAIAEISVPHDWALFDEALRIFRTRDG